MRILIARLGAFGDTLITTPVIKKLKGEGYEIFYLTTEDSGAEVLKNNPNVDKIIKHKKDSIPLHKLVDFFKATQKAYECDKLYDLCESLECNLSLHPTQPEYNLDKESRKNLCNKNYYEECYDFIIRKYGHTFNKFDYTPEMFFTDKEEEENARFREKFIGKKIIVWGLSGSSLHKFYPHTQIVMSAILEKYKDVVFITVGDRNCEVLEGGLRHERVIWKSNKWSFRQSCLMVKHAFLTISPDTGLLHASGCWDNPKIGLLTSGTRENVTKWFKNDYSIESEGVPCAPCFRLIYNAKVQCPCDPDLVTPFCCTYGLPVPKVISKIERVLHEHKRS
jgi:ADP-heptose:LPS heptosyltransferase